MVLQVLNEKETTRNQVTTVDTKFTVQRNIPSSKCVTVPLKEQACT